MNQTEGPQRHHHGITKKLVEGTGGLLVGAALVIFLRALAKGRYRASAPPVTETPTAEHGA